DQVMGAGELTRTGTTANYRTIHLQRLANPLLPWNPLPGEAGHEPTLPVNPYRTIDLSSVDLTAFDGASNAEESYTVPDKNKMAKWKPFSTERDSFINNKSAITGERSQHWYLKSLER